MVSRPNSAVTAWSSGLGELLAGGEAWLMERVLASAKAAGYAAYTSTLVEPWRVSVSGLTRAVVSALEVFDGRPHEYPLTPRPDTDPIAAFAVLEAKRHRGRGVTLAMFWGLLKYYRRAYLDLLRERLAPGEDRDMATSFVAECFERMEFVFVLRWSELSGQETIDELRRENLRLTNEKNRYLTVFESIPHALFLLGPGDRVENCNAAALKLLGHVGATGTLSQAGSAEADRACREVSGRPVAELLPWLEQVLAEVNEAGTERFSLETTAGSGDQTRHYNAVIEPMRDISGRFGGKVVLVRDVTNRRQTEIALARSEELYRTLVDIMHQGLVIFSPEGRIDFANDTLGEMLGYPLADIVGQPATAFIRPEDHTRFAEALASRPGGGTEPYELTLRRRDNGQVFVMSSPSPIVGQDGDYQGSLEVMTDVSRLKQLEVQLATVRRLEAIGHMAGGVAHEINTPLQYVSGNLDFALANLPRIIELLGKYEEALQRAECGQAMEAARNDIETFRRDHDMETVLAELPQALDESRVGAERVAAFVRSIKRFARTEGAGRRAIDVNEAILATVEIAKSAQDFPVCLETDLAENLPPLSCIPGDFNQLLLCLLLNAAQAMEKAADPTGCVRVASHLDDRSVAVSISDSGPGIPLEIQDKIFNPFYSTRDVGQGGGQGLAIALAIVEKHKGAIRFVSEPGHGTTFHVTFPLD